MKSLAWIKTTSRLGQEWKMHEHSRMQLTVAPTIFPELAQKFCQSASACFLLHLPTFYENQRKYAMQA